MDIGTSAFGHNVFPQHLELGGQTESAKRAAKNHCYLGPAAMMNLLTLKNDIESHQSKKLKRETKGDESLHMLNLRFQPYLFLWLRTPCWMTCDGLS